MEIIDEIASKDWKKLGRELEIRTSELERIEDDFLSVKEKSSQMLLQWKKEKGRDATTKNLADALIAIGRRDVAEKLLQGNAW